MIKIETKWLKVIKGVVTQSASRGGCKKHLLKKKGKNSQSLFANEVGGGWCQPNGSGHNSDK